MPGSKADDSRFVLGVGGIAVGLAAQKSIENLIGAVTLLVSQPVTIGDFCRAGNTLGVVEEIGLRATMLRTLDRTIVSIPNAVFANMDIENLITWGVLPIKHVSETIVTILDNLKLEDAKEDLPLKLGVLVDTIIDKANGLEKALYRYMDEN